MALRAAWVCAAPQECTPGSGAPEPDTTRRIEGFHVRPACLRRHCRPGGHSLPEVVHLAEDLLVLDVAAVLLSQRRAAHGALEAPHVPDEVVDLGRGESGGGSARASLHASPQPPCRQRRWGSDGARNLPHFPSVTRRLREVETDSSRVSDGIPGAQRDTKTSSKPQGPAAAGPVLVIKRSFWTAPHTPPHTRNTPPWFHLEQIPVQDLQAAAGADVLAGGRHGRGGRGR